MTDRDHDDELVSAALDGEAPPDDVARVEGDPALAARLAELRAAADAVAAPVPPLPSDVVDRLVDVAIASDTADDGPTDVPDVVPLARRRPAATTRWLAVAAAVLVVLALPALLWGRSGEQADQLSAPTQDDGASDQAAPSAEAGGAADFEGAPGADEDATAARGLTPSTTTPFPAEAAPDAAASAPAAPPVIELGDLGELPAPPAAAAADRLAAADDDATTDADGLAGSVAPACATVAAPDGVVTAVATARLPGAPPTPVLVLVVDDVTPTGPTAGRVLVIDPVSCAVIDEAARP